MNVQEERNMCVTCMTYEQVEERIEAINDESLKINNEIVEANWIIKNIAKTNVLKLRLSS